MDLTSRKYKFIEQFMKIMNAQKIKRLEKVLHAEMEEEEIVAYSIKGEALTRSEYIRQIKEADASISEGQFTTVEDLEKEVQKWQ